METIVSTGFYEISHQGEIAIIKIKKNVFDFITDMKLSGVLLDFIDNIHQETEIKALLYYNEPDSFSDKEYDKFLNRIMIDPSEKGQSLLPDYSERNTRAREINYLNGIIKKLSQLHIFVVAGIQGTIVTPYMGTAMAADFRYACEGSRFSMAHNKYGLHPSGGLPFFLTRLLNHSQALDIMSREFITAKEALDLGLITKILQNEDFVDQMILEIRKITRLKYCTIQHTKRLTNYSRKSLFDYFDYEGTILNL
jgi:2-(1,2-epoxy-1,2-dihydrophenyl)acetyl-CoA isomerase